MLTPTTSLQRKVGIEVEMDDPRVTDHPEAEGWNCIHDGSIRGREYVLASPTTAERAAHPVKALSAALKSANFRPRMRGSIHIHVSAGDLTDEQCYTLNEAYHQLQPELKKVIASYRFGDHGRRFAPCVSHPSVAELTAHFNFANKNAPDRSAAKSRRRYAALNFAMMSCANATHRTIEFRQFSTSTRLDVIYGYAVFAASLVEAVKDGRDLSPSVFSTTLEAYFPEVKAWLQWREIHLKGTSETASAIKTMVADGAECGVYQAAKLANCSVGAARAALESLVRAGHALKIRPGFYTGIRQSSDVLPTVRQAQASWLFTP